MSECELQTWNNSIFKQALKVQSTFRGPASSDVPERYKQPNTSGRDDFLVWANMPHITYSAQPETLYDMEKLRGLMRDDRCFAEGVVSQQSTAGVIYPKTFYLGLFAGGLALVYSIARGG